MASEGRETLEYVAKNISYITPFNGDKYSLAGFLNRIESLIPIIEALNDAHKVIVLGYITDKITGKARETLIKNGVINTWAELKRVLKKNHGERTPVNDLIDELNSSRCESNISKFYEKISNLLCKLNNANILDDIADPEVIESNQRLALKVFTENLPPLAKNLIACRNPDNLEDAYDLLAKYGYLSHDKNKSNNRISNRHANPPVFRNDNFNRNHQQIGNHYNNFYRNDNNNAGRNNYRSQQNHTFRRYPNSGQIRNPDSYRHSFQNNYNHPNNNVEPMDISINENPRNLNRKNNMRNNTHRQNFRETLESDYPI